MKFSKAKKLAKKYSAQPSIRVAGVTKNNHLVTELECVRYQMQKDNMKRIYWDGTRYSKKDFITYHL